MLSESRYRENFAIKIGGSSAILTLIKLNFCKVYPYLKLNILFDSKGLAIWSGFPEIAHIEKNGLLSTIWAAMT